jgi:hypothetical protein
MSGSTFELTVSCADSLATIEVVDAKFERVREGIGQLSVPLPRGLYAVHVRSGDSGEQRTVRLRDADVHEHFDDVGGFAGGVGNVRSAQTAISQAFNDSRQRQAEGWIAVAVPSGESLPEVLPMEVLSLDREDWTARTLVASKTLPNEDSVGSDFRLWVADLPIGWYVLALPGHDGQRFMLPLRVTAQASPTVFARMRPVESHWVVDLDGLLVSYDAGETAAFQDPVRLRAVEMARRSLETGRNALTPTLMDVLMRHKMQDPMLGLLVLQLMLMDAASSPPMFAMVMRNMARFFGADHPDLVIARAQARKLGWRDVPAMDGDDVSLTMPPLLRASWNRMVDLRQFNPAIVKRGLLRNVAQGLLRAGTWVVWKGEPADVARLVLGRAPRTEELYHVEFSLPSMSAPRLKIGGVSRPSRSADKILNEVIDQVRVDKAYRETLVSTLAPPFQSGTLLDRTLVRTILHIAQTEPDISHDVARGTSSKLARSMSLPLPLVADSLSKLRNFGIK